MNPLRAVLQRHDILYGVVFSADGRVWEEHGSRDHLPVRGLADQWLKGPDDAANLHGLLVEAASLPKLVVQGDYFGLFCMPSPSTVVAAFVRRQGMSLASPEIWTWSERLCAQLASAVEEPG